KMGLFPVHTWLPDAHSEAPTPVSALLSGSLLAVSFYAILRFYQVAAVTVGSTFPRGVLLAFGVASLLLAALCLFGQRDIKRLLAYSSVEHMGILAIGVSFGAPIALAGVLLHVLAHAAAKGNAFMGAGVLVHKFGTKRMLSIRGALDALPWSGPLFLFVVLALGALPPSGIFRSEFEIVEGGLASARYTSAAVLVILVTAAFFGLAVAAVRMLALPARPRPATRPPSRRAVLAAAGHPGTQAPPPAPEAPAEDDDEPAPVPRGEPSAWMVVPVVAGAVVLIVLGVHPPAELNHLLARAVHELSGGGA
ncbi:MAG TPA: proton-conducting transporter membrane subunit, partial [Streptosporangiaceae bacterium]